MERLKDTLATVIPGATGATYAGITFGNILEVALYAFIGASVGYFAKMAFDFMFKKK